MEQKRPADIIQELLDYLWNGLGLEEKGWKRLKKGDFKKKMKNGLTYQIWFDRSHYNYIDYENRPWKCGGGLHLYHKARR